MGTNQSKTNPNLSPKSSQSESNVTLSISNQTHQNVLEPFQRPKEDFFIFQKNEEKFSKSSSFFSENGLSKDIIRVTGAEPDISLEAFYSLYHTLLPQIEKQSDVSLKDAWTIFIGGSIFKGSLCPPEELISERRVRDIKQSFSHSDEENHIFRDLDHVVKSIFDLKQKVLDFSDQLFYKEDIVESLNLLQEFYLTFRNRVKDLAQAILEKEQINTSYRSEVEALEDLLEPKAVMMSDIFSHHWAFRIPRSKAQKILSLDASGLPLLKRNLDDPSNHRVVALPEGTNQPLVFFKANGNPPIQPEKEFMLYSLYRHLQIPVPETALLILTDVFDANPDYFYAVQASEAVIGESPLKAYRNSDTVFDHEAYFSQVIGALLTNPSDGSFKNFKYSPKYKTFISIDNEEIFKPELVDENVVNVKSMLYLLPQMDQIVPEPIRTYFMTLDPHLMILAWLQDLSQKNRNYQLLFSLLAFQKTRCFYQNLHLQSETPSITSCLQQKIKVDPDFHGESFYPQIYLSANSLTDLTEKLQKIEKILLQNRSTNLQTLFEEVSPNLGKYYHKLRVEFNDPEEALEALWGEKKNGVNYSEISSLVRQEEFTPYIINQQNNELIPEEFFKEFKNYLISGESPLDRFVRRQVERRRKNVLNLQEALKELRFLIQEGLIDSKSVRDIVDFCHDMSKIGSDQNLIKEIISLFSNLPNPELKWLLTLEKYFLRRDRGIPKDLLSSSITIFGAFMKQRTFILTELENQYIFDKKGDIKKNTSLTGRSSITCFPEKDPQFYLKQYPEFPGYEFASTILMRLLGIQHLPYHDLLIVSSKYPALLTQRVDGQPVFRAWSDSQAFSNLDPVHTGLLIISAMLSNPEDGKEDNLRLSPDGKYLIPIDNDHCFLPSTLQKEGNFWNAFTVNTALQTKTILFCLDEMKKPIPLEVKAQILSIDFDLLLSKWMKELDKLENTFNNLVDQNQRSKFLEQGTVMRIPFYRQFIQNIHWKAHLIQNMLKTTFELTPFDLLKAVEPFVAKCYQESFKQENNLKGRFKAVTNQLYTKTAIDGSRVSILNTRTMMEIINISDKELQEDAAYQRMGPVDAIELLNQLTQEHTERVQREQEMLCELDEKKEEGIWSSLFGNPLVETSLKAFLADPKEGLVLKGSKLITNSKLKKLFEQAPNQGIKIRFLSIPESPLLTSQEIKLFAQECPNLEYLNVSGSPKLKEITTEKGEWPLLGRLEAKECLSLEKFVSHSPIRILRIGTDRQIEIFIKNPHLDVFATSTKANQFELSFKTCKDFEINFLGETISNNDFSLGMIPKKEEIDKCFRDLKITIGTDLISLPKDIGTLATRMNSGAAKTRTEDIKRTKKTFQSATSQNFDLDERKEDETLERIIKKEAQSIDDDEDIETSLALRRCHERYKLLKEKVSKVLLRPGVRSRLKSGDRKMDIDFASLLKYYISEVATLDFPRNKIDNEKARKLAKNSSWLHLFHLNVNCKRMSEKECVFSLTDPSLLKLLPSNTSWYNLSWLRDEKRRALPPFPPLAHSPQFNTLAIDFEEAQSLSSIASWHKLSTDIYYFDNTDSTEASVLLFKTTWADVLKLALQVNSIFSHTYPGEVIVLPVWTHSLMLDASLSEIPPGISSSWNSFGQLDFNDEDENLNTSDADDSRRREFETNISQINNPHVISENKLAEDPASGDQQQSNSFGYAELGQEAPSGLIEKTDSSVNEESISGFTAMNNFLKNPGKHIYSNEKQY